MSKFLRILTISNHYPPYHAGGYGLLCQWLSEGLAQRGHIVRVLSSQPEQLFPKVDGNGFLTVNRGLQLISKCDGFNRLIRKSLNNAAAVRRQIRVFNPDVVYCHGIDGVGFQVYHSATESGVPSLSALGDTWLGQAWRDLTVFDPWIALASGGKRPGLRRHVKKSIGALGRRLGLYVDPRPQRFHPCTAISQFVANDLANSCRAAAEKVPVVPPMLARHYFQPSGRPIGHGGERTATLRALFVGRMEMLKGPDTAIRGLAAAVAQNAGVSLTFAGLGLDLLRPSLQKLAENLAVADRIHWNGTPSSSELLALFRSHDVFVFPSRIIEGFGLVNAEAMACGLPVIGAAHSGSADIIIDDVTGFRVAADDAGGIGHALARLHRDRKLLERLSRAAMETSARHHPDHVLEQVENRLYEAIETHRQYSPARRLAEECAA